MRARVQELPLGALRVWRLLPQEQGLAQARLRLQLQVREPRQVSLPASREQLPERAEA